MSFISLQIFSDIFLVFLCCSCILWVAPQRAEPFLLHLTVESCGIMDHFINVSVVELKDNPVTCIQFIPKLAHGVQTTLQIQIKEAPNKPLDIETSSQNLQYGMTQSVWHLVVRRGWHNTDTVIIFVICPQDTPGISTVCLLGGSGNQPTGFP